MNGVKATSAGTFLAVVMLSAQAAQPLTTDLAWQSQPSAAEWTANLTAAISATALPQSVPKDIGAFCARYSVLPESDRAHFWAGLISAIAARESGFNPKQSFTESFHERGVDSPLVVSAGLLQLSFPADRNHYHCAIDRAEDLYDANANISCGVTILDALVTRDHQIAGRVGSKWRGGAAYWSTLRSSGGKKNSNATNLAWIQRFTRNMAVCLER